jgi:hypothetical protein
MSAAGTRDSIHDNPPPGIDYEQLRVWCDFGTLGVLRSLRSATQYKTALRVVNEYYLSGIFATQHARAIRPSSANRAQAMLSPVLEG